MAITTDRTDVNKGGRPALHERRLVIATARVSQRERAAVEAASRLCGVCFSVMLRRIVQQWLAGYEVEK